MEADCAAWVLGARSAEMRPTVIIIPSCGDKGGRLVCWFLQRAAADIDVDVDDVFAEGGVVAFGSVMGLVICLIWVVH